MEIYKEGLAKLSNFIKFEVGIRLKFCLDVGCGDVSSMVLS